MDAIPGAVSRRLVILLLVATGVLLADCIGLPAEHGAVVLPLPATQILWINLVTDGPPALALGVDPADKNLMRQPPRAAGKGVLTPQMWRGMAGVGVVMAAGTLFASTSPCLVAASAVPAVCVMRRR